MEGLLCKRIKIGIYYKFRFVSIDTTSAAIINLVLEFEILNQNL